MQNQLPQPLHAIGRFCQQAELVGERLDVHDWSGLVLSLVEAEVNSQGCKPLGRMHKQHTLAPNGATEPGRIILSPHPGLGLELAPLPQGLRRWAIGCRHVRGSATD